MAEPKSFFRKLLKRPNLSLRRSTGTPDPSTAIQPHDVHAFEKIWLDIHDVLAEPDEKQILKGITSTAVPARLKSMLGALTNELDRTPQGATGPFLECFMNTEILHQLVHLSQTDRPFGIKAEILKFTTSLIKLLPYRFLLHSAIHQPVSRLIRSSMSEADLNNQGYLYGAAAASPKLRTRGGSQTDGDEEEEEDEEEGLRRLAVRLLVEVCERMKAHPLLLLVFLSDPADPSTRKSLGTDFIFFSCLLRYTNQDGDIGRVARDGLMTLFETIFCDRETETPKVEKPEAEIFTLEDEGEGEDDGTTSPVGPADQTVGEARLTLAKHVLAQDLVEVLVSGISAVYSVLPTKIKLPPPSKDDIDYEGGLTVLSNSNALFDMNEEDRPTPGQTDLPSIQDEQVQDQLALLADLVDFTDYILLCCRTPAIQGTGELAIVGTKLAEAFERTIATSFVDQVIAPFVSQSSVHDGSCAAIACYLSRLVMETSVAEGTVMHLTIARLLEQGTEGDRPVALQSLTGLGFLQVIVSKTKSTVDL